MRMTLTEPEDDEAALSALQSCCMAQQLDYEFYTDRQTDRQTHKHCLMIIFPSKTRQIN